MEKLRSGFTTGSCAAAAAAAATFMLLSGTKKENIIIDTPKGVAFAADVVDIAMESDYVSCSVIKDGGDDPDVTSTAHVNAMVKCIERDVEEIRHNYVDDMINQGNPEIDNDRYRIYIDGGKGVGRVTKPGLDQPVGNAAINSIPRQMIANEVGKILELFDFSGDVFVIISVPEGEEIAKKTFNPRLGIEGGISILGTSGIVEPMSTQAIIDTIAVEISQRKACGCEILAVSPGNYGLDFMKKAYDYDIDKSVKCSNFIGDMLDIAVEKGFKKLLLTGHIGKLIKVSGGMMNTHSKEGDCRMELLAAAAIKAGISADAAKRILECVVTEEALHIIQDEGLLKQTMDIVLERVLYYIDKRTNNEMDVQLIIYANEFGELARSAKAAEFLKSM